ncbi:hypothetical protein TWF481_009080 [Arthrobotrys musiformis]|uniref:Uncharacterized protein n=1 Tax=Arthrobotrys musiformis TaxID=47236 RepID=A0AAV9W4W1_9PEZI
MKSHNRYGYQSTHYLESSLHRPSILDFQISPHLQSNSDHNPHLHCFFLLHLYGTRVAIIRAIISSAKGVGLLGCAVGSWLALSRFRGFRDRKALGPFVNAIEFWIQTFPILNIISSAIFI